MDLLGEDSSAPGPARPAASAAAGPAAQALDLLSDGPPPSELSAALQQIEALKEEIDRLQREVCDSAARNGQLASENDQLKREVKGLTITTRVLEKRLVDMSSECAEHINEIKEQEDSSKPPTAAETIGWTMTAFKRMALVPTPA